MSKVIDRIADCVDGDDLGGGDGVSITCEAEGSEGEDALQEHTAELGEGDGTLSRARTLLEEAEPLVTGMGVAGGLYGADKAARAMLAKMTQDEADTDGTAGPDAANYGSTGDENSRTRLGDADDGSNSVQRNAGAHRDGFPELNIEWVPREIADRLLGVRRSKTYQLVKERRLEARKLDSKLMISVRSIRALHAAMPSAQIGGSRAA